LAEAAADGSFSHVAQLLSRGDDSVDVNAKNQHGHTALHEIAAATASDISSHDRLAVVDKLVDSGADVAARNSKGHTPLHIAADVGNADAASALLARRGVDANAIDGGGNTPLHFAAEMGHSAVAEVLLEGGATVNRKNNDGHTPARLTDAVRWHEEKYRQIVRVIERYGGELRRSV
jgi:ankyrin repeat protein